MTAAERFEAVVVAAQQQTPGCVAGELRQRSSIEKEGSTSVAGPPSHWAAAFNAPSTSPIAYEEVEVRVSINL